MFRMAGRWYLHFSSRGRLSVLIALGLTLFGSPTAVNAQEVLPRDSLYEEVLRLRARLDSLLQVVRELEGVREAGSEPKSPGDEDDPLAALRAAAAAAAGVQGDPDEVSVDTGGPTEFVDRGSSLQALNPEITVTGDFLMLVDSNLPRENNFIAREFEISLQSNLDPYSRAKVFIGRHLPGGELNPFPRHIYSQDEGEFEVEEGYIQWLNLPLGLGLSLGKFRQKFGQLNRWHSHSLPGQQLPLPYQAFFGDHGLSQSGASLHWLAPIYGAGTYELWFEVTRSGNEILFGASGRPSVLGHLNAFYELNRSTYFEIGATAMTGPSAMGTNGQATQLLGTDFTLSWRPPERALYREAVIRGGAIWGKIDSPMIMREAEPAFGAFIIGEYKLGRRWTVGSRYEYTQDPLDPDLSAWLIAPTLTWWQSEYVRIRAEFDNLRRPDGTLRQFIVQTTVSMGPHKHDNY